jgi:hypothetical protein
MIQFLTDTIASIRPQHRPRRWYARRNGTYASIVVPPQSVRHSKKPTTVSVSVQQRWWWLWRRGGALRQNEATGTPTRRRMHAMLLFAAGVAPVASQARQSGSFQLGSKRPFEGVATIECHSDSQTQQCDWAKNIGRPVPISSPADDAVPQRQLGTNKGPHIPLH